MNVNVMEKAETPVIPGEVQRYLNIDLSPAGEAARNLNERVGYDASREEIRKKFASPPGWTSYSTPEV